MQLYAIQIRKSNLDLITLLNCGVTPRIEKKKTFLIFDATWNSELYNQPIVTERELLDQYEIRSYSPLVLLKLKK